MQWIMSGANNLLIFAGILLNCNPFLVKGNPLIDQKFKFSSLHSFVIAVRTRSGGRYIKVRFNKSSWKLAAGKQYFYPKKLSKRIFPEIKANVNVGLNSPSRPFP